MQYFIVSFFILCAICVIVYLFARKKAPKIEGSDNEGFISFRNSYVIVYLLAMAGDWLQGPYVYALYEHYGMSKRNIEFLFVAGFGSSLVFGTIAGSFADKYGRKRNCIMYGIIYGLSCLTKHFNNFWILLIGRLLGGIATSILWSGFEAWLVHEHHSRGFGESLLEGTFSLAFLGNSIAAISSGVVAQYSVDLAGFVAPFDCALVVLIVMTAIVATQWNENYGDANAEVKQSFIEAWRVIRTDRRVLCLGIVQSLFEGSMYCFVLEWTPALTPKAPTAGLNDGHAGKIPHGYIFAAYMVSMMIGSQLFPLFCALAKPENFMRGVLGVSCITFILPVIKTSDNFIPIVFVGFLLFELCLGLFWPAIGTMRSKYVPDKVRATMMNFFRIPLNLIVVIILTQNLPISFIFKACTGFLLLAMATQCYLYHITRPSLTDTIAAAAAANQTDSSDAALLKQNLIRQQKEEEEEQQRLSERDEANVAAV